MNKKEYYEGTYLPQMHRFGKLTNWLGVLLCFLPCIVLGIGWGAWPEWSKLPVAFGTGAATFGFLWVMEPIGYYPVVGPIGTYMAFLSGNISNMRVPCATMAQKSAEVEPGTEEGALIGTIGMATSILINVGVLTVGVVIGSLIMSILPDSVKAALNYLLPALFGALLIQFGVKDWNRPVHAGLLYRHLYPDSAGRIQVAAFRFQLVPHGFRGYYRPDLEGYP